jgi:hypothetical protein
MKKAQKYSYKGKARIKKEKEDKDLKRIKAKKIFIANYEAEMHKLANKETTTPSSFFSKLFKFKIWKT